MSKEISIICAVKNRTKNLKKSLATWSQFTEIREIIIVDWDSDIPLEEEMSEEETNKVKIVRVENKPAWCLTEAYNRAAEEVTSPLLLKLDADISIMSERVFEILPRRGKRFLTGNWRIANDENEVHQNGVLFCATADFRKAGGYNKEITTYGWDDDDLYYRICELGLKRTSLDSASLHHIPHSDDLRLMYQESVENCASEIEKNRLRFRSGERRVKAKPIVSIITSVFDGDRYIENYLEDITKQTIFPDCELILINPNSPGNEEPVINKYLKKYTNIRYVKLDSDPGLYDVWNLGIKTARGEYITNANLDDRRAPRHLEAHVEALVEDERNGLETLVVAAALKVTNEMNENWEKNTSFDTWFEHLPDHITHDMLFRILPDGSITSQNMLHCMPVWKKSFHTKFGYFDEENYGPCADWELWLRASSQGETFRFLQKPYGLYLTDPCSHNNRSPIKDSMDQKIVREYYNYKNENTPKYTKKTKQSFLDKLIKKFKKIAC